MKTTSELIQAWREGTITLAEVQALFDGESREFIENIAMVKQCRVRLIHPGTEQAYSPGLRCVLPATHQEHDSDHRDKHGCRAPSPALTAWTNAGAVLVSTTTVRMGDQQQREQRDEDQAAFDRAYIYAGQMLSFDIAPNGDVVILTEDTSEGTQVECRIRAGELAGMAEASRNKRQEES